MRIRHERAVLSSGTNLDIDCRNLEAIWVDMPNNTGGAITVSAFALGSGNVLVTLVNALAVPLGVANHFQLYLTSAYRAPFAVAYAAPAAGSPVPNLWMPETLRLTLSAGSGQIVDIIKYRGGSNDSPG